MVIDEHFCMALERQIDKALQSFTDKRVMNCCCDGIVYDAKHKCFTQKFVNDKRHVMMNIFFLGSVGGRMHDLVLLFGSKALSRYARDLDITPCIPAELNSTNMDFDVEKAPIIIQLD